jgi:hypothetical protein
MNATSDMRTFLNELYASFTRGETAVWEDGLASDALIIGTDETEWWQGTREYVPVLRAQVAEMHGAGIAMTGGHAPVVGASGDAVWAADRPTMRLGDGTEMQMRLTIVARYDGDHLLINHMHLSCGTPNEESVKQVLTV